MLSIVERNPPRGPAGLTENPSWISAAVEGKSTQVLGLRDGVTGFTSQDWERGRRWGPCPEAPTQLVPRTDAHFAGSRSPGASCPRSQKARLGGYFSLGFCAGSGRRKLRHRQESRESRANQTQASVRGHCRVTATMKLQVLLVG